MAVDQALLTAHANEKCGPTLRIYQWDPPAISLGYFQRRHGINLEACGNLGIDVIRRPTGGRAVLHFGELTYSIVAGTKDGIPTSVSSAYQLICKGLLSAFRILGFEAEMRDSGYNSIRYDNCFLTNATGDVRYKGKKFVGSAQTWYQSSMLQHGSIILETHSEIWAEIQDDRQALSRNCEELIQSKVTSIKEILGHMPAKDEIRGAILNGMERALGIEFARDHLTGEELMLAGKIADLYNEKSITRQYQLIS